MSFALYGSAFVAGVTKVGADFLNNIRTAVSRAVDGTGGGAYTPSATIDIDGAGMNIGAAGGAGLVTCRRTGALTVAGNSATTTWRVPSAVADADTMLTIANDMFLCSTPTADRYHGLSNTGAVHGMKVTIKRPNTGNFVVVIRRNATGAGAAIVTMAALTDTSAEFWYISGAWRLGPYSAGCTPGVDS